MALDERLKKIARIDQFRTQPIPGARGGESEGGGEGGGTAETVIAAGSTGTRKLTPNEQGHSKPFLVFSGTTLDDLTAYTYHGIRVDNFTPQFMRVHGLIDAYIPPNTYGVQIPVMMGSQKAWVTWESPPGYTQPTSAPTQVAIIYFTEALINPSAGIDIAGFAQGAADLRVNIDQVGGVAVATNGLGMLDIGIRDDATGVRANPPTDAQSLYNGLIVNGNPALFNGGTTTDRARSMSAVGDGLGVALASQPGSTPNNANANNALVTVTYTAVAGQKHRITSLSASYTGVASVGALALTCGDGVLASQAWDVPAGLIAPVSVPLPPGGEAFTVNTTVTLTLSAGGAAGSIGQLNSSKLTA